MEKSATKRQRENDDGEMSAVKRSRVEFHQIQAKVYGKDDDVFEILVRDVYFGAPQKTIEAAVKAFIADKTQAAGHVEPWEVVVEGYYKGLEKHLSQSFDGSFVGLKRKLNEWARENDLEVEITHNKYEMSLVHDNDALSVDEINQIN